MVIRSLRYTLNGWSVVTGVIALSLTIPILYVGSQLFGEASEVWTYVVADLLPGYALNSLVLLLGVGGLTLLIGTPAAWLVAAPAEVCQRRSLAAALTRPAAQER